MTTDVQRDLEALAARLRASTVAVRSAAGQGSGSGVIWAGDARAALIVTNAHVAVSRTVEIEFADERRVVGTVERRDAEHDLASIRVAAGALPGVEARSAAGLRPGEMLVAFGHPLGIPNVLTTGIAFGPHRLGSDRFVRADVRLAPGNSGGALADVHGRVVGINSMIAGGLALAIPTDEVQRFLGDAVAAPRLGVALAAVEVSAAFGGRRAFAVLATEPDSAAERAGILVGDVILTRSIATLATATTIEVLRGGVALTIPIDRTDGGIAAAA